MVSSSTPLNLVGCGLPRKVGGKWRKVLIPAGEKVEADKGYRGAPAKVRVPGNAVSKVDLLAKDRARTRHETVNKRFKQWGCLQQVYRHDIEDHYLHFACVAVLTQLSLQSGEPLYNVHY